MKKILTITILVLLGLSFNVKGQVKLGLKFAPIVSTNRVDFTTITQTVPTFEELGATDNGTFFRLSLGLIVDKSITDSYSFSTGLIYTPKIVGISVRSSFTNSESISNEDYRLQYLQVPLTFKLYTNEVAPGFKIYFQVGGELEVLVFDEPVDDSNMIVEDFKFFDAAVVLGAGVEYNLGASTILFAGFSYHRGLIDVVDEISVNSNALNALEIRNTIASFDLGIKF